MDGMCAVEWESEYNKNSMTAIRAQVLLQFLKPQPSRFFAVVVVVDEHMRESRSKAVTWSCAAQCAWLRQHKISMRRKNRTIKKIGTHMNYIHITH